MQYPSDGCLFRPRPLGGHVQLEVTRRDGSVHTILYDEADHDLVQLHRWHVWHPVTRPDLFYARTNIHKPDGERTILAMQTLLMNSLDVDHINRNGLDNRRCNLRLAS